MTQAHQDLVNSAPLPFLTVELQTQIVGLSPQAHRRHRDDVGSRRCGRVSEMQRQRATHTQKLRLTRISRKKPCQPIGSILLLISERKQLQKFQFHLNLSLSCVQLP